MLTLFGSLTYLGTLLAPFFGVAGDRTGRRKMMCAMRAFLAVVAGVILAMALSGELKPAYVMPAAFLTGLVRPSDLVMRNSLIGDTMPQGILMSALGLSRMTMDTARIVGALAGASLFATLGIAWAYVFVVAFYVSSFLLTLGVSRVHVRHEPEAGAEGLPAGMWRARWRELRDGMAYVWKTPGVLGVMALAFVVNFTAFPLSNNLLPYVAKEIYGVNAQGLSHLVAGFATGALIGSMAMAVTGARWRSARFTIVNLVLWYLVLGIFAWVETKGSGFVVLFFMGMVHSLAMVSMAGVLLRAVSERFRARVQGIRMLCVYALPIGLLGSGPLIEGFGYPATATLYVALGIAFTALITWRWRRYLWH
jgi:MFS family permease